MVYSPSLGVPYQAANSDQGLAVLPFSMISRRHTGTNSVMLLDINGQ